MRSTRKSFLLAALVTVLAAPLSATGAEPAARVRLETTLGDIVLELDREHAPATVENFLTYVNDDFYDGTIFHRVIDGFMIQGGGFTSDFSKKSTRAPVKNEAENGLKNDRGTISMARTRDPHSATAQFFINVADNAALNHTAPDARGWGYTVFGRVVEGMDVVDEIRARPTGVHGRYTDVPKETISIERAVVETP